MTASLLLYLGISGLAAILCLWAGATAAMRVPEHERGHRLILSLSATLVLPAAGATALASPLGYPELAYAGLLLPLCVLGGTWANIITLRDQGLGLKLMHLPTFLFNCTLLGLYTVRMVQDFAGQDLATWGGALTIAHIHLQTAVGHESAAANPVWFHLPFLLPLCLRFRWLHVTALMATSTISCYMLLILVTGMPQAHTRSQSYRLADPPKQEVQFRHLGLGVKVPWGQQRLAASTRWQIREALLDLKPDHVTLEVAVHTFGDDALMEQVKRELGWAREQGYGVTVVCLPPVGLTEVPSGTLVELKRKMAETQWLAAEQLKPDLVVLFSGPYGQLAGIVHEQPTLEQWLTAIRQSAGEVRQANPKVKVAVSIESLAPHAGELFKRLKAHDSPVDVVGLSIFPGDRLLNDVDTDLHKLARLVERSPGNRAVGVLEVGCAPQSVGGEFAHWRFLERVLAFCSSKDQILSVSIDSLQDPAGGFGLVTFNGRRRQAFQLLSRLRSPDGSAGTPGK